MEKSHENTRKYSCTLMTARLLFYRCRRTDEIGLYHRLPAEITRARERMNRNWQKKKHNIIILRYGFFIDEI